MSSQRDLRGFQTSGSLLVVVTCIPTGTSQAGAEASAPEGKSGAGVARETLCTQQRGRKSRWGGRRSKTARVTREQVDVWEELGGE